MIKLEADKIRLTINIRYPIKSSAKEVYDGIRDSLRGGTNIELVERKILSLYMCLRNNFLV